MTTWAPITGRHPWLNPPTMKRKFPANDDRDDDFETSSSSSLTSHRKRVRHDSLERTLAHMTLGSARPTPEDADMWPRASPPRPRVQKTLNVVLPSSIEEPDTPTSPIDDMEVEPAVVTTEVASDDWNGVEWGQLDIKEVQISPAVFECLRRQTQCPPPLVPLSTQTSQALVLYRVPRPPSPPSQPSCDNESIRPSLPLVRGDDVMEVE